MRHILSHGRIPKRTAQPRLDPLAPPSSPISPTTSSSPHPNPAPTPSPLITGREILEVENVELRRVLIERLGYENLIAEVGALVRDRDRDKGGERQLLYIPFEDDEPLMLLKVICPSTGHLHVLRVPPHMRNCHQAAAWIAGFNHPDDYNPAIEA